MTTAAVVPRTTHIVVVGNEKGGCGKSTTAMHVAVALMKDGFRVATVDLDTRQRTFTAYVENRRIWAKAKGVELEHPTHKLVTRATGDSTRANTWADFETFAATIGAVEHDHDFVVVDTPGHDTALARMAHSAADTLVTPINDSFVDLDVIAHVDPVGGRVKALSHYAAMVVEARNERRAVDGGHLDWVIVRNRLASLDTRNRRAMGQTLDELSRSLGFRVAPGVSERVIFREFFAMGLTAVDGLDVQSHGAAPTMSHVAARQEVRALIETLRLPVHERALRRMGARQIWQDAKATPLEVEDFIDAG